MQEEEESYEDSRMERITTVLAVIGAVLIGCAVIFLVGRTMGIFESGQESGQVPMIAVSGMSEQEAVEALRDAGMDWCRRWSMKAPIRYSRAMSFRRM